MSSNVHYQIIGEKTVAVSCPSGLLLLYSERGKRNVCLFLSHSSQFGGCERKAYAEAGMIRVYERENHDVSSVVFVEWYSERRSGNVSVLLFLLLLFQRGQFHIFLLFRV